MIYNFTVVTLNGKFADYYTPHTTSWFSNFCDKL